MKPLEIRVDWSEPTLKRWLDGVVNENTLITYKTAWRYYQTFLKEKEGHSFNASQLIDEALEDQKRDIRERRDSVRNRLLNFHHWLTTEYEVLTKTGVDSEGRSIYESTKRHIRPYAANTHVNSVRSFYATFEIAVKLKGRSRLPRSKPFNRRLQLSTLDVKALVDHARTPRDRAIILTLFQGGLDESTLCGMKYADVSRILDSKDEPFKLELFREKAGVDYYTFLGKDASNALRAYLRDLTSRGVMLKAQSPLWITEKKEPLNSYSVEKIMREAARRSGLVDGENNGKDQNPAGSHALRESFSSILINNGVPDSVTDFWQGHSTEMSEAYKGARFNELRAMYLDKERFLSIGTSESELAAITEKRIEGFEQTYSTIAGQLRSENQELRSENAEMKAKIAKLDLTLAEIQRRLDKLAA